jgi:hypothetical protein
VDNLSGRNHYLPQAYLRRFCDASGKVLQTFLGPDDKLHEKRFVPKETGYEWDLYTLKGAGILTSSSESDDIEKKVFGPVDDNGALVLNALHEGAPSQLSAEERTHLAVFVNSLLERHPQRIRERDQLAEQMARERFEELKKAFGKPNPDGFDILDLIRDEHVEQLARNLHREHMVREIQDPKSIEYLSGIMLSTFTLSEEQPLRFFTSDNPVLVNGGRPWPVQFFTLALSPRVLLIGVNDQEPVTDPQMIFAVTLVHCLELPRQTEYVFSQDPIVDYEGAAIRSNAQATLRKVNWRRR